MGEAWSDWYAMDFLVDQGFQKTPRLPARSASATTSAAAQDLIRTQPLDCPVGTTSATCPGTPGPAPGGYTYGDFGKILGRPGGARGR